MSYSTRPIGPGDRLVFDDNTNQIIGIQAPTGQGYLPLLPAASVAATQALVSTPGNLASPILIAKTNQNIAVNSANVAADNSPGYVITSFVLPGGMMGPNGSLQWQYLSACNNVAQDSNIQLRIGSTNISVLFAMAAGAVRTGENSGSWDNTAAAVNRYWANNTKSGTSTALMVDTAIDTSVDQTVTVIGFWNAAVAGGTITLRKFRAWVEYGA